MSSRSFPKEVANRYRLVQGQASLCIAAWDRSCILPGSSTPTLRMGVFKIGPKFRVATPSNGTRPRTGTAQDTCRVKIRSYSSSRNAKQPPLVLTQFAFSFINALGLVCHGWHLVGRIV